MIKVITHIWNLIIDRNNSDTVQTVLRNSFKSTNNNEHLINK